MKQFLPSKNKGAFTLIELLTVIAIIGILAAIILPTVASVRETARKSRCTSNLRQIAMAMVLYTSDHRGNFPAAADQRSASAGGTGIFSAALVNENYLPKRLELWLCPTHLSKDIVVAERAANEVSGDNYPRSYAICGSMIPPPPIPAAYGGKAEQAPLNLQKIGAPSKLLMLTEWHSPNSGVRWAPQGNATQATIVERVRITNLAAGSTTTPLSHHPNAYRNFAFADGHVQWMSAAEADQDHYWRL